MLEGHCDRLGRNYDDIIKSTNFLVFPIDKYADYVNFYVPGVAYDHEPVHRLAESIVKRFS